MGSLGGGIGCSRCVSDDDVGGDSSVVAELLVVSDSLIDVSECGDFTLDTSGEKSSEDTGESEDRFTEGLI